MTVDEVPGVGPVVAPACISAVDDPQRFDHARDVGAYLELTPKRYLSGNVDRCRIFKCGDAFVRIVSDEADGCSQPG